MPKTLKTLHEIIVSKNDSLHWRAQELRWGGGGVIENLSEILPS